MENPNSQKPIDSDTQPKEEVKAKKPLGQFLGVQLSAPEGMKNPRSIFLLLVFGNFLLLFLIGKGLRLF